MRGHVDRGLQTHPLITYHNKKVNQLDTKITPHWLYHHLFQYIINMRLGELRGRSGPERNRLLAGQQERNKLLPEQERDRQAEERDKLAEELRTPLSGPYGEHRTLPLVPLVERRKLPWEPYGL